VFARRTEVGTVPNGHHPGRPDLVKTKAVTGQAIDAAADAAPADPATKK